jgi:MOSC domain-containing protein YiiM
MVAERHLTTAELEAGLDEIRRSPATDGTLELIVARPAVNQREVLSVGRLNEAEGLIGDDWNARGSSKMPQGGGHPDMQLTLMNARAIALISPDKERWKLAGDQLYVDLELSGDNLPPGTRLTVGEALLEVTPEPHTGCKKFVERFGLDAMRFVNSPAGKELRLRGMYTRVIRGGEIRPGDVIRKA